MPGLAVPAPWLIWATVAVAAWTAWAFPVLAQAGSVDVNVAGPGPPFATGGCEDTSSADETIEKSIQALQRCIETLQQYAKESRVQQGRSLKANERYAGDISATNYILKMLQDKARAHRRLFRSFQRDQQHVAESQLRQLRGEEEPKAPRPSGGMAVVETGANEGHRSPSARRSRTSKHAITAAASRLRRQQQRAQEEARAQSEGESAAEAEADEDEEGQEGLPDKRGGRLTILAVFEEDPS